MSALKLDTLILVPNQRAQDLAFAECLLRTHATQPLQAPAIEVFSLWAARVLEDELLLAGRTVPLAPAHFRIRRLWESAISQDHDHLVAADLSALAGRAMEADRLIEHWLLPRGIEPGESWSDDTFCVWRRRVHAEMARRGWLNPAEQLRWLIGLIHDQTSLHRPLPAQIKLRGFVEITPLERRLLNSLEGLGVEITLPLVHENHHVDHLALFEDTDSELRDAVRWARVQKESGARVALLVNELPALSGALSRLLHQEFHPQAVLGLCPEMNADYHLHLGRPLVAHPVISQALDLLELSLGGLKRRHHFGLISRWLLSSGWAGAMTESSVRAQVELKLREQGRHRLSLLDVARCAESVDAPLLRHHVSRLVLPDALVTPAQVFREVLSYWGWPGSGARGAETQQAVNSFSSLFEDIEFTDVMDRRTALEELRRMCAEQRLNGPGGPLSAVQVMQPEGAIGQHFDAIRLVNFHAENWPAAPQSNPFLPRRVAHALPRSDCRSQFEYSRNVQGGCVAAAQRVTLSWSAQVDGAPTSASPLSGDSHTLQPQCAAEDSKLARRCYPGPFHAPERVQVGQAKALGEGGMALHGAINVMNLQSACPWACFLVHRLDARFPSLPQPFVDHRFRGWLLHEALFQLYRPHVGCGGRPGSADVAGAVDKAISETHAEQRLATAALAAEHRRLTDLLENWLLHEPTLPLGSPVALERKIEAQMAGFNFQVRLDRIDDAFGGELILDYKSGSLGSVCWDQPRMSQVQLPLYAVILRQQGAAPQGVGLLSIKQGEMKQKGLGGQVEFHGHGFSTVGVGDKPLAGFETWDGLVDFWAQSLEMLLDEFRDGDCSFVVHDKQALQWLGLDLLFRMTPDEERNGVLTHG